MLYDRQGNCKRQACSILLSTLLHYSSFIILCLILTCYKRTILVDSVLSNSYLLKLLFRTNVLGYSYLVYFDSLCVLCVCGGGGWNLKLPSNSHHQQYNLYVICVHIFNRKYHTLTVILAYVLAIFMGYIYVVKNVVFLIFLIYIEATISDES